jgi:hypothetical protein
MTVDLDTGLFEPDPGGIRNALPAIRMSLPSIFCSPEGARTVRLTSSPDRPFTLRVSAATRT